MITVDRVLAILALYAALFIVITTWRPGIPHAERRTALVIGLSWAIGTFTANFLLFKAGFMSFLPWANNFLHTFVWIGLCLTFMYLGLRRTQPLLVQMIVFATFSLVVKYAEQMLFGTWEHGHFFHVLRGNVAYVVGWSIADGLYPPITLFCLRGIARFVKGLVVV
jgi:hypothetical protein